MVASGFLLFGQGWRGGGVGGEGELMEERMEGAGGIVSTFVQRTFYVHFVRPAVLPFSACSSFHQCHSRVRTLVIFGYFGGDAIDGIVRNGVVLYETV